MRGGSLSVSNALALTDSDIIEELGLTPIKCKSLWSSEGALIKFDYIIRLNADAFRSCLFNLSLLII